MVVVKCYPAILTDLIVMCSIRELNAPLGSTTSISRAKMPLITLMFKPAYAYGDSLVLRVFLFSGS